MTRAMDSGISSLSTSSRKRRGSAEQKAAEIREWLDGLYCIWPPCKNRARFYCSDDCRTLSLDAERAKRTKGKD